MGETIIMSKKELERVPVIHKALDKRLTQIEAAKLLNLSDRQIRRIVKRVRIEGDIGLIHKNRGKESNRKLDEELINNLAELYKNKYPDWIYTRHEDLSENPVEEFRDIYNKLELTFTQKIENKIIMSTSAKKEGNLKRDSRKNIHSWKKRLDNAEINRIKKGTESIANHFYSDTDW